SLMQPTFFLTKQTLKKGAADQERRATIAKWITSRDNPWFSKAFVNRVWSELVGTGFYNPIDDLGPERESSAPKSLTFLSEQFAAHDHDVKWLFEAITQTQVYQRAFETSEQPAETPFVATRPQRLRGDQLFDSLMNSLGLAEPSSRAGRPQGGYARGLTLRGQFSATFGFDPSLPREELSGSIPQALAMMNSRLIGGSLNADNRGTVLGGILAETRNDEAALVEVYLRTLAREPSNRELKTCLEYIREVGDRKEAFEDVQWSLINSTEFLHRR
ncbi:MAG: DUF1553 domain-containing protein, partial [Planctomycetales bacterium]